MSDTQRMQANVYRGPYDGLAPQKHGAPSIIRQRHEPHPLGFHIWRDRRGWPTFAQRVREAAWILSGKWSLHCAWQKGYDDHTAHESARVMRGGK